MKPMKYGQMYDLGDIVIADVSYTDISISKRRPALVLFEEHDNVVVMGITSNTEMDGIPLTKKEGMAVDSVIKLNYIFTISKGLIYKKLFSITESKKKQVCDALFHKINR